MGNKDTLRDPPSNAELAATLDLVSELLSEHGANRFRVEAYHRAAETLRDLETPAWHVYERDGLAGLDALPRIGRTISRALQQLIRGGRWPLLKRLNGEDVAESAFASIPSIGPKLAQRIHAELGIESLAELEAAAWDGRLGRLQRFGEKRVRAVRESLAARGRLSANRSSRHGATSNHNERPIRDETDAFDMTHEISIAEILDIDREYRTQAQRGKLPRIAPKRNNPAAEAWLPVLHAERGDRHYTALFSNTGHAHAMGMTRDWVVIYLENHHQQGQHGRWTVITSKFGRLKGKRIVRGREDECRTFYEGLITSTHPD